MNEMNHVIDINHKDCLEWVIDYDILRHISNRYFSIVCLRYNDKEHLMIKQDEIGLLGFVITKKCDERNWLIQNKPEPGNINYYQIAPTVQATKSNYERVHGGKKTNYLKFFNKSHKLILNTLGSEQGDRFLNKFNRNCKVLTNNIFKPINNNYFWMNNEKLKQKLQENYTINTDARSVISSGCWYLLTSNIQKIFINSQLDMTLSQSLNKSYHSIRKNYFSKTQYLLKKINNTYHYSYELIPIREMEQHSIINSGIVNNNNNKIISFFEISFQEREVKRWQQPLLVRSVMEYCILVFHIFDNTAKFYLNAYAEIGFTNRAELGPTFQTGNGILKTAYSDIDNILKKISILTQIEQSDEGSRFYRNSCKYILGQWKDSPDSLKTDHGIWLSAGEIEKLSYHNGILTNELRTTLSLLLAFA